MAKKDDVPRDEPFRCTRCVKHLTGIERSLIHIEADVGHNKRKLEEIDETLRGNGDVGIVLRVDRHHQTLKSAKKLAWLLVAAIVGLAATIIRGEFKGGG